MFCLQLKQGDQIRRFFAHWVIVYLRHFLKNTEVAHIAGLLFFTWKKLCINIDIKMVWTRVARWFIFKPNPYIVLVYFENTLNGKILTLLWPIGILCGHLLYFMATWYILLSSPILSPFWYIVSRTIWQPWTLSCILANFSQTRQGSMLWSQFSAIFDNFLRKNWRFF
jgi:hypothetical protein